MKKYLIIIIGLIHFYGFSQSSYLSNAVNFPTSVSNPTVLIGANPIPSGTLKVYIKDDIRWEPYNINGLTAYINGVGDIRFKNISYTPTYGEIIASLGFTPYNNTNPNGYINSFTELDPTVPAYSKTLTSFSVIKSSTDILYKLIGYTPSSLEIITSLGFTPVPNSRTINGFSLTSNIVLVKGDIGLGNVDNTSDLNKPISTSTQTALNGKLSSEIDGSITNELQTLSIVGNTVSLSLAGGSINLPKDYDNTVNTAGGAGNAIFYITNDKTSTGTALYTNITYVNPIVNDSALNYTYGWSYNSGTKALTVNVKEATGINVALVGLTLLGVPANVADGKPIQVMVKGN